MSQRRDEAPSEARFKIGDQWYYRGNRSPSWFFVASRADGSCQGGISERVPVVFWPMLEEIASLRSATPRSEPANARAVAWLRQIGHHWSEFGVEGMDELMREVRAYAASLPEAPQPATRRSIDIVFDGPPDHKSGRFVEVESPPGTSISFGQWVQRVDGYWVLRFVLSETPAGGTAKVPEIPTAAMTEAGDLFFTNESFVNVSPAQIKAIYRAMLAAAPSPDGNNGSAT
jgi:hypothetical protein